MKILELETRYVHILATRVDSVASRATANNRKNDQDRFVEKCYDETTTIFETSYRSFHGRSHLKTGGVQKLE